MLWDHLNLKGPQGVSQKATGLGPPLHSVMSDTLCPWSWSPSSSNSWKRAFGITPLKRHGHSSQVPEDHGFTLHFKFYLLWGFISVIVQTQKENKNSLCYTCFEICVQMLLTTTTCLICQEGGSGPSGPPCPHGGDLSRFVAGFGKLIKRSEQDTISWNIDGCTLHFDVVLQDVCGNVHLYLDTCYVPFFF